MVLDPGHRWILTPDCFEMHWIVRVNVTSYHLGGAIEVAAILSNADLAVVTVVEPEPSRATSPGFNGFLSLRQSSNERTLPAAAGFACCSINRHRIVVIKMARIEGLTDKVGFVNITPTSA